MFGKGSSFPDGAETPSWRYFRTMMYYDASKVWHTALGTILHRNLQFTSGTKNFSSAERCLKTVPLWPICDRCYRTKRGQGEVSDEGRPTSYRK